MEHGKEDALPAPRHIGPRGALGRNAQCSWSMKARRPDPNKQPTIVPDDRSKERVGLQKLLRGRELKVGAVGLLIVLLLLLRRASFQPVEPRQEVPSRHAAGPILQPQPVQISHAPSELLTVHNSSATEAAVATLPVIATPASFIRPPIRAGLLVLVIDNFPPWWPFLVASYLLNHPQYELITMQTGPRPNSSSAGESHIRYEHIGKAELAQLFARKLGASLAQAHA